MPNFVFFRAAWLSLDYFTYKNLLNQASRLKVERYFGFDVRVLGADYYRFYAAAQMLVHRAML